VKGLNFSCEATQIPGAMHGCSTLNPSRLALRADWLCDRVTKVNFGVFRHSWLSRADFGTFSVVLA